MRFGGLQVLERINWRVPEGSIAGLIGPNGAGKTTVFNIVTGLLRPSGGSIDFRGTELVGLAPHAVAGMGLARTFQNIRIFKQLRLIDNVIVGMHRHLRYGVWGSLMGVQAYREAEQNAREGARELLAWVRLDSKSNQLAGNLSYGEQRRLELARALATRPKLLLLDEPVAGMNDAEKTELMQTVRQIRARGFTVLLIEHDMRFVMGLCDDIAVLNFGRVIASGTPDAVRSNPQVVEAYLGPEDDLAPLRLTKAAP
jgi:branched-chain amino acid transport system ATP-binding protein